MPDSSHMKIKHSIYISKSDARATVLKALHLHEETDINENPTAIAIYNAICREFILCFDFNQKTRRIKLLNCWRRE